MCMTALELNLLMSRIPSLLAQGNISHFENTNFEHIMIDLRSSQYQDFVDD